MFNQEDFINAILNNDKKILSNIKDNNISAEARINIYKNNVFTALTNYLLDLYPLTVKFVDKRFFLYAANEYIKQYPSNSGNLDDYGEYFTDFLKNFPATQNIPYISDIAKLEWYKHLSYFAKDAEPCDFFDYKKAILHPSCFLLDSKFPIYQLYKLALSKQEFEIKPACEYILISRIEFEINIIKISKIEFAALNNLSKLKDNEIIIKKFMKLKIFVTK